jgi:hypothetical protein
MLEPMKEDDWGLILSMIKLKACTPFLGAGACYKALPLGKDIAHEWSTQYGYPLKESAGDLAKVAQFIAVEKDAPMLPKLDVTQRFAKIRPPDFTAPDEPHAALASLPLPIYITTNYDDFMYKALQSEGKKPQRDFCRWNSAVRESEQCPSVLRPESGVPFEPKEQEPLVYHLHGLLEYPQSLVLTEDDYLNFLVEISANEKLIPPRVQRALTTTSLIFLGYSLNDIDFRVIFRSILRFLHDSCAMTHVSVQIEPKRGGASEAELAKERDYLEKYFGKAHIRFFWGTCREFAGELRHRCKE